MPMASGLRFGPFGPNVLHLCVDMQTLFAERTDRHVPWPAFGLTGCCSSIGSGIGFGVPVGDPTVAEASDQYVTSALITAPPDYQQHWSQYRLEVAAGSQRMAVAAPAPTG
jgi:hypothetical protein